MYDMEKHSLQQIALLHAAIRDKAKQAYLEAVKATPALVHPYIDQTYRSFEESDKLYAQGRTTPGQIVSNAKGGQSWHNYGLALDFHLIVNGKDVWDVNHDWMTVVNIFKAHGFTWGGNFSGLFKDYPHLEMKCGLTLAQAQKLYTDKDFIPGTQFIKINNAAV